MSRVQLALDVSDIDRAVEFYTALLGVGPHKRRPGYAGFAVAEPPLKLVLIENPQRAAASGPAGALNHLGIEVAGTDEVDEAARRLGAAGLATTEENDTTCCWARQDKVWVHDPDGAPWEVYTVTDDDPADARRPDSQEQADGAVCCAPAGTGSDGRA